MFSIIIGNQDVQVLVAINSEGIFVIAEDENVVLLGLKYEEFCWAYAIPSEPNNPDCYPCLYLQFQASKDETKLWKLLQIFSKQAAMMDALISTFVEELKLQKSWEQAQPDGNNVRSNNSVDVDEVDVGSSSDLLSDALVPLNKTVLNRTNSTASCISNKLNRLSLATFNEEGDCIGQTGSLSFNT